MMKIELTISQMEAIEEGRGLNIDNEKWILIDQDSEYAMDENGKYIEYIYKRSSDERFFRIVLCLGRYGYEDYGFEFGSQDRFAYEVERKMVMKYEWVSVK